MSWAVVHQPYVKRLMGQLKVLSKQACWANRIMHFWVFHSPNHPLLESIRTLAGVLIDDSKYDSIQFVAFKSEHQIISLSRHRYHLNAVGLNRWKHKISLVCASQRKWYRPKLPKGYRPSCTILARIVFTWTFMFQVRIQSVRSKTELLEQHSIFTMIFLNYFWLNQTAGGMKKKTVLVYIHGGGPGKYILWIICCTLKNCEIVFACFLFRS